MIIDTHCHYSKTSLSENELRKHINGLLLNLPIACLEKSVDEIVSIYRDYRNDENCDKMVKRMDANGIGVSVLCVVDNIDNKENDEYIIGVNEACAKAAARHPGRFISLAGIDPRRPNAPALFRKCITDFKMNGLKWHPDQGYYPDSKEAYAVLAVANEFGVPLLTHSLPLSSSRAKFAHPIHLDDIALDFPNVQIIAAHMGGALWWREWAALADRKKTISGDLAAWQKLAVGKPAVFRKYLREIVDILGHEQILWASDTPGLESLVSNKKWLEIIKGLTVKGTDGIVFSKEEVDAILGGNAVRIFKLKIR